MLTDALDSIAADDPVAAPAWLNHIMERTRSLTRFPDSGRIVPELGRPDIRELLVDRYRIPYRRDEGQVTILAVLHGRRSLPAQLGRA